MAFILGRSKTTAYEGESFVISLGTSGLGDGTTVPYSISGIDASDILEPLSGDFTITSNYAEITINVDPLLVGSKEFRLNLTGEVEFITLIISNINEYINEPCHVLTSDTFDLWRKKHNGLCAALDTAIEGALGGLGVARQHYDATAAQTVFPIDNVNPDNTIVTVNGHILDDTGYTLTASQLTYIDTGYELLEDDDVNLYDFSQNGGISKQFYNATALQTVFPLGTNVHPDHTVVMRLGHILDNTDYALTKDTLTLVVGAGVNDDINLIDFSNGYIADINMVVQDEGTPLATRNNLNFVGAGVVAVDNPGNDSTDVTISTVAASEAWVPLSGNQSLATGSNTFIDASSAIGTFTFPASPNNNDAVTLALGVGDLSTYNYILDGGTKNFVDNIQTPATTFTLNSNFPGRLKWIFNTTLDTWILT